LKKLEEKKNQFKDCFDDSPKITNHKKKNKFEYRANTALNERNIMDQSEKLKDELK